MHSYSTDVITGIAARLFRMAALVERLSSECPNDHREVIEKIRLQIQRASEALYTSHEPSKLTPVPTDER